MPRVLLTLAILTATAFAQTPQPAVALAPMASPSDIKLAKKEFKEGAKAKEHGHTNQAYDHFKRASELNPHSTEYVAAREMLRQYLVYEQIEKGNQSLAAGQQIEAMGAFRSALDLDPENAFAKQRLIDSVPALPRIEHTDDTPDPFAAATEIRLQPNPGIHTFKFRGNSRQILEQVAQAYGLIPVIDDSVKNQSVRFEVGDVEWPTASELLAKMCKVFWIPLSAKQVMFVADDDQNRRALQRMAMRTFYIPNAATTQDLNDLANTLRVLFDIRYLTVQPASNTIVIRAAQPIVDAATSFLDVLSTARPQVLLEIKAYQVSRTYARQIGTDVPRSFTAFNIPTEAQRLLGNQSIQDIINQLIASGAINQAGSAAIAALVAQGLGGQSSLFSQPFGVFGGGITLTGVTLPPGTLHLNMNSSEVRSLENVTLRAGHGEVANFKIGTRYPIVNATFAPIFNSSQINKVLANQTYIPPLPSVSYEDLGIMLKTTPQIRESDVRLDFELEIRSLGSTTENGIPIINNREYKGVISAMDGQSIVIGGLISNTEQTNLTGLPLISSIPGLGVAFSTQNKSHDDSELLLVVTPHILRSRSMASQELRLPPTAPK
jgi:tetratricopeptide (TPR) repeat protein